MTTSTPQTLPPAGLLRQVAAMGYDALLVLGCWVVVTAILMLLSGGRLAQPERPAGLVIVLQVSLIFTAWLFFAWFWTHGGQTLGMRAWRLKLVGVDQETVRWPQTVVRFAMSAISIACFGLGYLWKMVDPDALSWPDRVSGTRLVVTPAPHKP